MEPAQRTALEALGTDKPVGLLAIPAEHAAHRLEELQEHPSSAAALQKELFGEQWARVPRDERRAVVEEWAEGHPHSIDSFLAMDLRVHGLR